MSDVTLAILAGGEGARMGVAKGDLRIGRTPILAYLLRRMAGEEQTMLVTAPGREHPPACERFDREVVDPVAGQGPLRGVLTALEHASTPIVVVATVDMPGMGREQLRWYVDRLSDRPDILGVMARRGEQIEPFPAAFRIEAADVVRAELQAGRGSVRQLCERAGFVTFESPPGWDERTWTNLNRPQDLQAFLARSNA